MLKPSSTNIVSDNINRIKILLDIFIVYYTKKKSLSQDNHSQVKLLSLQQTLTPEIDFIALERDIMNFLSPYGEWKQEKIFMSIIENDNDNELIIDYLIQYLIAKKYNFIKQPEDTDICDWIKQKTSHLLSPSLAIH